MKNKEGIISTYVIEKLRSPNLTPAWHLAVHGQQILKLNVSIGNLPECFLKLMGPSLTISTKRFLNYPT